MPDDALLAETNRLLSRVLEIQEEERAKRERAMKEMEEYTASRNTVASEFEERMKKRLEERGLPPEMVEGSAEDWERRREEATRRSRENMETLRAKDETYKDELLTELRTQSDLLRRIAERLER